MHHYVSRNHSEYFFKSKKELDFDLVSDFSEKCSFPIKDAIQGFYWSNDHATVLPFLTYLKMFDGEKASVSIVIVTRHRFSSCFLEARLTIFTIEIRI